MSRQRVWFGYWSWGEKEVHLKLVRSNHSTATQNTEEHVKQRENATLTLGGSTGKRLQAAVRFPSRRDGAHDDPRAHRLWPVISGSCAICPVLPAGIGVWLLGELISLRFSELNFN